MKKAFPILGVLTAILLVYALYQALVVAPTEQTMGAVQRIFYYHVPSAWTAFLLFFVNFGASVFTSSSAAPRPISLRWCAPKWAWFSARSC
jgi:heme exporter protein C